VVIGTGGFASGPLLQVANNLRVPTVVQEQNSYPGITNKLLSKKARVICVVMKI
jgi:UDP-N-acetylglucosamine--N-acetylmuramyl-(pentapeptide) pyrophosphoryl-undecaprenol N-acetylglucosamine transferase